MSVHEVGRDGDSVFIVSALVRGVTLGDWLTGQQLTSRETAQLCIKIADALHHAHENGVVHRDLKPANIMIDGDGQPHIMDFGLARRDAGEVTITIDGQILGTPAYMSPEQAAGESHNADCRSDVYSLGVILFQLLTGELPFRGNPRMLMHQVINDEPPTPRKLNSNISKDLEIITLKCLEKDRTRRYETASALRLDLQRHLDHEPVLARPPSALYRMQKFARKHRYGLMAASAVLTALVMGLIFATAGFIRAKSDRNLADKARIDAQAQKTIADEQRELAVEYAREANENARKSDENARKAELRLAEGLLAQADALSSANRFADAHKLYLEAYDKFAAIDAPLDAAKVGLWTSYHQATPPLLTLRGHTNWVLSVAITTDARTGLSGSEDGTLKVWDLLYGKELRTFTGHTKGVSSVVISRDGETALSGSKDNTLKLWDLGSGKVLRTFAAHTGEVLCVAISPDGLTALSGGKDNTLILWDLVSGKVLRTFAGHAKEVLCVAYSMDGQTAISGSEDRTIKLWDLSNGQSVRTFAGHSGGVNVIATSPDGHTALSGSGDGTLKLWDVSTGEELRSFVGHTGVVSGLAITPDGLTALSGSRDQTLKLWDLASGKSLRTFTGHKGWISSVVISQDGRTALSCDWNQTLELWNLSDAKELRNFEGHNSDVSSVAISRDGRTVLSGSWDRTMKLWDMLSGKVLRTFSGHADSVSSVAISADGRTAISGSWDKTLKVWDVFSGHQLHTLTGHTEAVVSVAISPDGLAAISGGDRSVKLWDLASGRERCTFNGHSDSVSTVAISPDGRTALSGGKDNALKLWDLSSGREIRTISGHRGWVGTVAISPDGHTALSGGNHGTPQLWDLASGNELRVFYEHKSDVSSVAISPDSQTALACSWDKTLKLWDLDSGKEIRTFSGATAPVHTVAFSPDGQSAVSDGANNGITIRDFKCGITYRDFESRVELAQARLMLDADDPMALTTLGEWYAFCGMDHWAVELLCRAREQGAAVPSTMLAGCYWRLGTLLEARDEFQLALEKSRDNGERAYLSLCIQAIDAEPERIRQAEALEASERLQAEAAQELAAGGTQEALAHLAAAFAVHPDDTLLSLKVAALQAWFGQDAELFATQQRILEYAIGTSAASTAERAAKSCSLRPSSVKDQLEAALVLGRRAVELGKGDPYLPYFYMTMGMAEYRSGHYMEANEALKAAAQDGSDNRHVSGTSAFYLAMSLFRQGNETEARQIAADAASKMKPLPADEMNPLAGDAEVDDLILWMAYKDANALISFEVAPK